MKKTMKPMQSTRTRIRNVLSSIRVVFTYSGPVSSGQRDFGADHAMIGLAGVIVMKILVVTAMP